MFCMDIFPLGEIIMNCNLISYYFYADDTELYLSLPVNLPVKIAVLYEFLVHVKKYL